MYSVYIDYRDVEYDILRGEMRQIFIPTWPAIYQGSTLHVLGKDLERNVFYYLQLFAKKNYLDILTKPSDKPQVFLLIMQQKLKKN